MKPFYVVAFFILGVIGALKVMDMRSQAREEDIAQQAQAAWDEAWRAGLREAEALKAEHAFNTRLKADLVEKVGEVEASRILEKIERERREKRMLELQEEEVRLLRKK